MRYNTVKQVFYNGKLYRAPGLTTAFRFKEKPAVTNAKKYTPLLIIILFLAIVFGLSMTAKAQDFYGEGNVLIAVDMAPYAENEDVDYPEGTMGTLIWGADAPTGESTREAFNNRHYEVDPEVAPVLAPNYEQNPSYHVKQTVFLPFIRYDDPDFAGRTAQFPASYLPAEVFTSDGKPNFFIHNDRVKTDNGNTRYSMYYEKTADGKYHPCVDFLEIECVAVTEHCTIWQHTGTVCSTRTGFDPNDYAGAVGLTDAEIQYFLDTCDNAYEI